MSFTLEEQQRAYLYLQTTCGIKVGDGVEVIRQPASYESGWNNEAPPSFYVNQKGIVTCINDYGIEVKFFDDVSYTYPFFVLKKIVNSELVYKPNPFDKVLIRVNTDIHTGVWYPAIFLYMDNNTYICIGMSSTECIPYTGNEELVMKVGKPNIYNLKEMQ